MKARQNVLVLGLVGLTLSASTLSGQIITSGLDLWYRADAGVTVDGTGSNVVTWVDQSVNANDARQAASTPINQPTLVSNAINGLPALHFATSDADYLIATNSPVDLTSGLSIFIIARNDMRKDYNGLFKLGPSNTPFTATADLEVYWQAGTGGSGTLIYEANGSPGPTSFKQANNAPPDVGNFYLYDVIVSSSTIATQRIDGTTLSGTTFGSQLLPLAASYATIGVGYGGDGTHGALYGDIAEVVVYNTALTTTQRDQVANTLADKYGLTIPEPSVSALVILAAIGLRRNRPR